MKERKVGELLHTAAGMVCIRTGWYVRAESVYEIRDAFVDTISVCVSESEQTEEVYCSLVDFLEAMDEAMRPWQTKTMRMGSGIPT